MYIRAGIIIFLTMFLSGCASTINKQDFEVQHLQNRINELEAELQRKEERISDLEIGAEKKQYVPADLEKQKIKYKDTKRRASELSARDVQKALKNAGLYSGPIDGKMGPKTKEAVKDFQRLNGIRVDGIVGKRTVDKLKKHLKE